MSFSSHFTYGFVLRQGRRQGRLDRLSWDHVMVLFPFIPVKAPLTIDRLLVSDFLEPLLFGGRSR